MAASESAMALGSSLKKRWKPESGTVTTTFPVGNIETEQTQNVITKPALCSTHHDHIDDTAANAADPTYLATEKNRGEVIEDVFPSVHEVRLNHEQKNKAVINQILAYETWKKETTERPHKEAEILQAQCDKLELSADERQLYIFNQKKMKEAERLRKCKRDYMNKAVISIKQSSQEETVYVPNVNDGIARQVSLYSVRAFDSSTHRQ